MQSIFAITKALAFLTMLTVALSASLPPRASGEVRNVAPATWSIEIEGQTYSFNGTATSALAQLKELRPDFELQKRDLKDLKHVVPRNKGQLICDPVPGQPWGSALVPNAVDIVNAMNGWPAVAIPEYTCSLLDCIQGSQAWLCNDNNYAIFPASPYLASYITDIIDECSWADGISWDEGWWMAGGQEFDTDNYNIILRGYAYRGDNGGNGGNWSC